MKVEPKKSTFRNNQNTRSKQHQVDTNMQTCIKVTKNYLRHQFCLTNHKSLRLKTNMNKSEYLWFNPNS
ncbi:hypothetical protein CICLE_v10017413mg [Citrus x clementina]|uniref:Uncharacterized protein n=1 Tax=Citrus clementina TaxID=85681 RepID=V4TPV7_CITCL|nr:hypothetical protein CICLE_v10017413mg [Citrus x clementina]